MRDMDYVRRAFPFFLCLISTTGLGDQSVPVDPQSPAERDFVNGLWSLTTQPMAITLSDVAKKLHLDLRQYDVEGGSQSYFIKAKDMDETYGEANSQIASMTIGAPTPAAEMIPPSQELGLFLRNNVCLSSSTVMAQIHMPLMSRQVLCTDAAPCSSEQTYFASLPTDKTDKRNAIRSELRVGKECSRGITVSKTFDKEYWSANCPFTYTKTLEDSVAASAKEQFPKTYKRYDFAKPWIGDFASSSMELVFNPVQGAPGGKTMKVDIDRCDSNIVRIYEVRWLR